MKLEIAPYETFRNRSIISMQDFTRAEIESILDFTKLLETSPNSFSLKGKLMASCFFEPSTRTRLSFESAMKKLGGDVIGFSEAQSTSIKKKETLYDTIRMIEHYADLIVIRHPVDGSAAHARATTQKPVINAGDGSNQHPTQTLLDLYTIRETQGRLDQLHIAICGDLKHARTSRSLIQATAHFNMRMYFVPLPGMEPSRQICDELKQRGILFSFHPQLSDIIAKLDIVYMTRIQEERFTESVPQSLVRNYVLNKLVLDHAKPTLKVMHPLPRVNEIAKEVDDTPHAVYFEQARYGIYVRQALLKLILGDL